MIFIQALVISLIAAGAVCAMLPLSSAMTLKRALNLKLFAAALMAMAIVFSYSPRAYCSSVYIVTLSNGNVIEANSYSIEKDKVRLEYPVGEVSFPRNKVLSIKEKDGNVDLLQSAGVSVAHKEEPKPAPNPPALAFAERRPSTLGSLRPDNPATPSPDNKGNATQDAHAGANRQPFGSAQQPVAAATQPLDPNAVNSLGNTAEDEYNVRIEDAITQYMATDDPNEQTRLDQTIDKLLDEEQQKQDQDDE